MRACSIVKRGIKFKKKLCTFYKEVCMALYLGQAVRSIPEMYFSWIFYLEYNNNLNIMNSMVIRYFGKV